MPWQYLGVTVLPAARRGKLTGSPTLECLLFFGTIFAALASANGCINDAARAWFSLGRDRYLPTWFSAVHPKYRTPYRSILFLVPIALAFAFVADLGQAITFSILSGVLHYTFMSINIMMFRKQVAAGHDPARLHASVPPAAGDRAVRALRGDLLRDLPGLRRAAHRDGGVLHHRVAVVPLLPLPLRAARRPVHHAVAEARVGYRRRSGRAVHFVTVSCDPEMAGVSGSLPTKIGMGQPSRVSSPTIGATLAVGCLRPARPPPRESAWSDLR